MKQPRHISWRLGSIGAGFLLLRPITLFLHDHVEWLGRGTYSWWLFGFLAGAAAHQLVMLVLSLAAGKRKASPFLSSLYDVGFLQTLGHILRRQLWPNRRLLVVSLLCGFFVFAVIWLFWRADALATTELWLVHQIPSPAEYDSNAVARIVHFWTPDNNQKNCLTSFVRAAEELRRAGATGFIIHHPWGLSLDTEPMRHLYGMLDSLGVLFLTNDGLQVFTSFTRIAESDRRIRLASGFGDYREIPQRDPTHTWSVLTRFRPILDRVMESEALSDIGLRAMARRVGLADTVRPVLQNGVVRLGPYTIPVTEDGGAFVLTSRTSPWVPVSIEQKEWEDSLTFVTYPANARSSGFPSAYADQIRGKVVWIDRMDPGTFLFFQRPATPILGANVMQGLAVGTLVRKSEGYHHLVSLAIILLGIVLTGRMKAVWTFVTLLSLAAVLGVIAIWLLREHLILAGLVYPTAAALLSAVVFPLVRLSHDNP